jgi:hypothetical protein
MIIKGGSRAAPGQLAWHLQRRDTNEDVRILELQSPAPNLGEAFRDWQTLTEGTRGTKGLYHANIDPAKGYTMTPEQWQRAVDVLEKELKLDGQPRAVVLHEKHGRQQILVVWARTDIDEMTLRSDSQNYLAHERASQTLEIEFGHEPVPGKHAKRDREKQPEFPRADADHAEWQQGERTGIDPATRKERITALKQACDNGQTFKAALEEQGYILARGDRRDFVIVDDTGSIHSLGRQVQGMTAAELRAFMKDVDREALPTAAEAVTRQVARAQEGRPVSRADPPASEAESSKGLSAKEIDSIKQSVAKRQAREWVKLREYQAVQLERWKSELERDVKENLIDRRATQQKEMDALEERQQRAYSGIRGWARRVQERLNPTLGAERAEERQRELAELVGRQEQETRALRAELDRNMTSKIDQMKEEQQQQVRRHREMNRQDLDRYLHEAQETRELRAQWEEAQRLQEEREEELAQRGVERPPPPRAR